MATTYWTAEDHLKWGEVVKKMIADGTYGKKVTYVMDVVPNPMYDNTKYSSPLTSASLEFLDFSS